MQLRDFVSYAQRIHTPCKEVPGDLFFPRSWGKTVQIREAKSICDGCAYRVECLEFALKDPDLDGIWGGTTPNERRQLLGLRAWR